MKFAQREGGSAAAFEFLKRLDALRARRTALGEVDIAARAVDRPRNGSRSASNAAANAARSGTPRALLPPEGGRGVGEPAAGPALGPGRSPCGGEFQLAHPLGASFQLALLRIAKLETCRHGPEPRSSVSPCVTEASPGGSSQGNRSRSFSPRVSKCNTAPARSTRRISGSVCSGRAR